MAIDGSATGYHYHAHGKQGADIAATSRVTILMSPEEKAVLDAKAAQAGPVSAGELVRRAVAAYDEEEAREAEELRELLRIWARTHEEPSPARLTA